MVVRLQLLYYNIKMDLREQGWEGVGWIHWLRIGTSGGLL